MANARLSVCRQRPCDPGWDRDDPHDAQTTGEVCLQAPAVARRAVSPACCMNAAQHTCDSLTPTPDLRRNLRQSAAATPRPDGEPTSSSSESYCGANGFLNPPARVGALGG